jgi:hypothetical protein
MMSAIAILQQLSVQNYNVGSDANWKVANSHIRFGVYVAAALRCGAMANK